MAKALFKTRHLIDRYLQEVEITAPLLTDMTTKLTGIIQRIVTETGSRRYSTKPPLFCEKAWRHYYQSRASENSLQALRQWFHTTYPGLHLEIKNNRDGTSISIQK